MFLDLNFDAESIPDGFRTFRDLSGELRAISDPKIANSQNPPTSSSSVSIQTSGMTVVSLLSDLCFFPFHCVGEYSEATQLYFLFLFLADQH